jgi:ubiquinone/menaquinone biosynthesis C-methylase UbiE
MPTQPSSRRSPLRWIIAFNKATNRLYLRWSEHPPHDAYYRTELRECVRGAGTAIHLGAGARDVRSLVGSDLGDVTIYAVDPSERSLKRNPNPNQIVAWGHGVPLPAASVDLIFSEYLMEQVEDVEGTIAEAHRLLRPDGKLLWMAPNLWSYSGLITHLTPEWFHRLVVKVLEPASPRLASEDVFPTYCRINSISRINEVLSRNGFEVEELFTSAAPPSYTLVLPGVHQLAGLLHIALDRFECLRNFRMVQIVRARRRADALASLGSTEMNSSPTPKTNLGAA